ncbi:MAG: GNAT family N-acetyltransferase [Thermaerobacter sp.]|nr:GNAT family N-acetyltransferase [Thermaerobacter sp.]
MDLSGIEMRELHTPEEMAEVVQLQYRTWGPADATPQNQLVISVKAGGHVIGAFDGKKLVSFVYGFPGIVPGEAPWIASHMLATLPDYAGRGIGRALKWRQRRWALERGFDRITWTFDPLEARNAHLNLNILGAEAKEYIVNCYGEMDDQLNRGLPSDRLMADWDLRSARVETLAEGEAQTLEGPALEVAVPPDFQAMKRQDLGEALSTRLRVREELASRLSAGMRVYAFDRAKSALLLR